MADIWKTEFHLLDPSGEAVDWLEDREEAISRAKAEGKGWRVQEVTSYLDDKETIFEAGLDEDDEA